MNRLTGKTAVITGGATGIGRAAAERGTLDIVFANARAGSQLPLGKVTAKHIDETFDTNVKGTIFTVQKAFASMTPLQRMADPAEIGAVAAFLASSGSSFMTASEVAVDGDLAQL
ncbi:hypothetical protein CDEF62S_02878 [Castellaniella defragrans]